MSQLTVERSNLRCRAKATLKVTDGRTGFDILMRPGCTLSVILKYTDCESYGQLSGKLITGSRWRDVSRRENMAYLSTATDARRRREMAIVMSVP